MRVLILLLLMSIGLMASMFDKAVALYKNGRYIQAYEKFYILHNKDKSNKKVSLYLSKCLYNLGEFKDAKTILKSLEKNGYKDKDVEKYLAKIEDLNKKHKFFFLASFGLTYDDNVKNNTYEMTPNYGSVTPNDTNKKNDTFANEMFFVSHSYNLPSYETVTWKDIVVLYNRNGFKYSGQDLFFSSLSSGPSIDRGSYIIRPKILLSNLYYGRKHYMYSYGVGLSLSTHDISLHFYQ